MPEKFPLSQGWPLLILGSKVKVTWGSRLKRVFRPYLSLYCTYNQETCQKCFMWMKYDPLWFWVQNVKGEGHRTQLNENCFLCIESCILLDCFYVCISIEMTLNLIMHKLIMCLKMTKETDTGLIYPLFSKLEHIAP